jgi:hypothetical protein
MGINNRPMHRITEREYSEMAPPPLPMVPASSVYRAALEKRAAEKAARVAKRVASDMRKRGQPSLTSATRKGSASED